VILKEGVERPASRIERRERTRHRRVNIRNDQWLSRLFKDALLFLESERKTGAPICTLPLGPTKMWVMLSEEELDLDLEVPGSAETGRNP
jgi:hypothetical protein